MYGQDMGIAQSTLPHHKKKKSNDMLVLQLTTDWANDILIYLDVPRMMEIARGLFRPAAVNTVIHAASSEWNFTIR